MAPSRPGRLSFPSRRSGNDNRTRIAAKVATVAGAVAVVALIAIPAAVAAFAARTENPTNVVTAVPDFTAPKINAVAIGKTQGGATGFVKQGGTYYVYANVAADTGNPASGTASVTANVETVTSGQTAVALVAGSYTAGGASYTYKSAQLTAGGTLVEGAKSFKATATDVAGNTRTVEGSVTVDNTAPKAADIQTTNVAAGTNGLAEAGDTVVFTFSEPVEPESILAGWTGASTNVVVRMIDNGLLGLPTGNDALQVYNSTNATLLPYGTVDMGRGDYVAGLLGGEINFGASGTPSTMVMSGNAVTITLGTYAANGILVGRTTAGGTGTMTWTPTATPYDRAANAMSTTAVTETGAADRDF